MEPYAIDSSTPVFTVYVVDDDSAVRRALSISLAQEGYNVDTYRCAEDFLENFDATAYGCIVLDVRMPGIEGLELQERLADDGVDLPIIFVTGHASVPQSVQAIKRGAVDFLEKPFRRRVLLVRIEEARKELDGQRHQRQLRRQIRDRLALLTNRELDVAELLVRARPVTSSKEIGAELSISPRTADQHRASVLTKMNVNSSAELGMLLSSAGVTVRSDKNASD